MIVIKKGKNNGKEINKEMYCISCLSTRRNETLYMLGIKNKGCTYKSFFCEKCFEELKKEINKME